MILFVAPNPHKVKEREGFMQRVAAIDEVFKDEEKYYFEDIEDENELAALIRRAKLIYVHSIYRSEMIIDYYPFYGDKIITDLHGVVPEEEAFAGNIDKAAYLEAIEKVVFSSSTIFVSVTNAMVEHYKKKYPESVKANWIVLPIFDMTIKRRQFNIHSNTRSIIYAGGTQPWQNVPLMIDAMNAVKSWGYKYTFLTHSADAFEKLDAEVKKLTTIKSVQSTEVAKYYADADFGFVLRDDVLVNKVACPTKLIEYLGNGVIPIVKSPIIGDFDSLGYVYITIEEFKSDKLNDFEKYSKAVRKNYSVINMLSKISSDGVKELLKTYAKLMRHKQVILPDTVSKLLIATQKLRKDRADLQNRLRDREYSMAGMSSYIKELENTIEGIRNSKKWIFIEAASKPIGKLKKLKPSKVNRR